MMVGIRPRNAWIIWFSFALALLLSLVPMPSFMDTARPLWLAMIVT
jgi:rod shape-determining protein MreD